MTDTERRRLIGRVRRAIEAVEGELGDGIVAEIRPPVDILGQPVDGDPELVLTRGDDHRWACVTYPITGDEADKIITAAPEIAWRAAKRRIFTARDELLALEATPH